MDCVKFCFKLQAGKVPATDIPQLRLSAAYQFSKGAPNADGSLPLSVSSAAISSLVSLQPNAPVQCQISLSCCLPDRPWRHVLSKSGWYVLHLTWLQRTINQCMTAQTCTNAAHKQEASETHMSTLVTWLQIRNNMMRWQTRVRAQSGGN